MTDPAGAATGGPDLGAHRDPSARLTVLGCDGGYPGPGGAASGYLVEAAGVSLWLDAGPGTFAALQVVTDPARVDAIVLSHEHPDHWSDVDAFAVWWRDRARRGDGRAPRAPVPVYAPPGLQARAYFGGDPAFAWRVVEPSHRIVVRPGGGDGGAGPVAAPAPPGGTATAGTAGPAGAASLVCSFCATDHGPPTLAVRIDVPRAGWAAYGPPPPLRSLAYSADTGPDWSVEELGRGIGTFLCEATFGADEEGSARHLSGRQAGAMARAAHVGRLVLTHRRPSVSGEQVAREAAAAFGGDADQAAPGAVFEW